MGKITLCQSRLTLSPQSGTLNLATEDYFLTKIKVEGMFRKRLVLFDVVFFSLPVSYHNTFLIFLLFFFCAASCRKGGRI
jgi:hypothetical protein